MYYISYATANDDPSFYFDRIHILRMAMLDSGVDKIKMFISISKVQEVTARQEQIIKRVIDATNNSSSGSLVISGVEYKSNIGRDFSSHACNLRQIAKTATDGDSVLFLNRSAYGPLKKNWYLSFLRQIAKDNKVVICGNTINLAGHPDIMSTQDKAHVQTYAFLSKFPFLYRFVESFPAETCNDRLDVIKNGEIGLSQVALSLGYHIASLAWPDISFNHQNITKTNYPKYDIKSDNKLVSGLPFRYKFRNYNKKIISIISLMKYKLYKESR